MALLISKINDIEIIQVGASKLSVENKQQDASKVTGKPSGILRRIGFIDQPQNKTIDLGAGKQKHTLKLFVTNRNDNNALFKILYNERFCTITDKFKGRLSVYINSLDVTDSDQHINRTVYDISCTVQDFERAPDVNFSTAMATTIRTMELELGDQLGSLLDKVDSFDSNVFGFIDSAIQILSDGITSIVDVKVGLLSAFSDIKHRVDSIKALATTLANLKDFPNQFLDLIRGLTNSRTNRMSSRGARNTTSLTPRVLPIGVETKTVILPIVGVETRGSIENLSNEEKDKLVKDNEAAELVNKVKVIQDLKLMLEGGFRSKVDFENTLTAVQERIGFVGYDVQRISDINQTMLAFAQDQAYEHLVTLNITTETPLTRVVYERYGALDNYDQIEAINGFRDNDRVMGPVVVLE